MAYSMDVYVRASAVLKQRREQAEATALAHKNTAVAACPQILEIEREMARTGLSAIEAIGAGKNAKKMIDDLAKYNLELQAQRKQILVENGFPADYLKPPYTCPLCEDRGKVDGVLCDCYKSLLKETAYKMLAEQTPLQLCNFKSFSLDYYSNQPDAYGIVPRQKMQEVFTFCKQYAQTFSMDSPSLFFFGHTGLGKTHLSLSIAAAAIEKGYNVLYGSAQNLFSKLEKEHFGKGEQENTEAMLLDCDLLILDDLGTEFTTGFVTAAFYNLVNTRLLAGKPTIINTNLNFKELEAQYSGRIVSRILGCYTVRQFYGEDLRLKKRLESL